MKYFLILIGLLGGINIFGQTDNLTSLVVNSIKLYEPNPAHFDETKYLNEEFTGLFNNSKVNSKTSIPELFDHINKNAITEFEDDADIRRIKTRLCLCYSSIAILSDRHRFEYYIDLAKYSLLDSNGKRVEFLEKQYCGLLMLNIFLRHSYNMNIQSQIKELDDTLDYYQKTLPAEYFSKSKMIVEQYMTR
jgi:hypothetical protein